MSIKVRFRTNSRRRKDAVPQDILAETVEGARVVEQDSWGTAAADDALGTYLKEMGSYPLLKRAEELDLARRLEFVRNRYRHAALSSWHVLSRLTEHFERVEAGEVPLERSVDVVPSLGLTAEQIRGRLCGHVKRLGQSLAEATLDFRALLRTASERGRSRRQRLLRRRLRKAAALAAELSPRTELLDVWVAELEQHALHLRELAAREDADEVRELVLQVRARPSELTALMNVIRRRQTAARRVRQELAEANLRLVVSIAKRFRGCGLPFADLIQEGNSGLMRAVDKFDYRLGFKFGTYATWWIRQGITRALSDISRMIRVPCHQQGLLRAVEKVRSRLIAETGREPTVEEVAEYLNISPDEARLVFGAGACQPVSLDERLGDDENTMQEFLYDPSTTTPGQEADQDLLKDRVSDVLRSLAQRDREVLEFRFGLRDGRPRTLEEISQIFGITRERIRQIEARSLQKLRQNKRLADFVRVA